MCKFLTIDLIILHTFLFPTQSGPIDEHKLNNILLDHSSFLIISIDSFYLFEMLGYYPNSIETLKGKKLFTSPHIAVTFLKTKTVVQSKVKVCTTNIRILIMQIYDEPFSLQ